MVRLHRLPYEQHVTSSSFNASQEILRDLAEAQCRTGADRVESPTLQSRRPPVQSPTDASSSCSAFPSSLVGRTFSVETKSAVSSRVNWLIWSTMVAILGFAGAAAASDCHLRCILCCAPPTAGRAPIAGRAAQTQRLRARDAGADMLCGECGRSMGWMDVVVVVDFCGQRDGGVAQAHAPQKSLVLRSSRGQARHRNFNVTTYPPPLYESVEIMGRRPESYIQHSYRSIAR